MSKTVNDNNKQGFFWHVHHEKLMEWCHSYDERAEYIRTEKSSDEQETRLRLFQPVKGNLPEEVIKAGRARDKASRAYDEAYRANDEAYRARDEARRTYDKAWLTYYKARRAYNEADRAYDEAWQVRNEARQAYDEAVSRNMSAIEALHAEECPNCPWNGHTIFPNA